MSMADIENRVKLSSECCLSWWFPKLQRTGVRVPQTAIFGCDERKLFSVFDGENPPELDDLVQRVTAIANKTFGFPLFLRTGQTSGKHDWRDTCFVQTADDLRQHIIALMEFSELADMLGLRFDVWVIREFIPMKSSFTAFNGLPINTERRYYIERGRVICHHPYWPDEAFEHYEPKEPNWRELLTAMNNESPDEVADLTKQSILVAEQFDNRWSLDWALSESGLWYAIDMARAECSYHWPGCPNDSRPVEAQ